MEPIVIKPEKEYKTVMYIVWSIILMAGMTSLIPLIVFIPDIAGKVVFAVILVIFVIIVCLFVLWIKAYYKTLEYSIESESLKMSCGVFWKKRVTVPYQKITNVDISQGPLERKYGLGTIHAQTAGAGGAQGARAELTMPGIRDFEMLKDLIMEKVKIHSSFKHEKAPQAESELEILRSMLKELRTIREALGR